MTQQQALEILQSLGGTATAKDVARVFAERENHLLNKSIYVHKAEQFLKKLAKWEQVTVKVGFDEQTKRRTYIYSVSVR